MKLLRTLKKWRGRYRRMKRILFPSPAEVRFIELMGGRVWRSTRITSRRNQYPLTIVLTLGKQLKGEHFRREVRYGKYFCDFANDVNRIIEIDGAGYHMDVVADMDREIYISEWCRRTRYDARILRIKAYRLYNDPTHVQGQVLEFLNK